MTLLTPTLLLFACLLLVAGITAYLTLLKRTWARLTGIPGVWLLGLPGIPLHETAHLLACLLFGHRILSVSFFAPGQPVAGQVVHAWNPRSFYQRAGLFFIAMSPLCLNLTLAGWCLSWLPAEWTAHPWQAALLVYLATSLLLHAAPSRIDLWSSLPGLAAVLLITGLLVVVATEDVTRFAQLLADALLRVCLSSLLFSLPLCLVMLLLALWRALSAASQPMR